MRVLDELSPTRLLPEFLVVLFREEPRFLFPISGKMTASALYYSMLYRFSLIIPLVTLSILFIQEPI